MKTTITPAHLDQIEALQDAVLQALCAEGKQHFIIPRSRAYFKKHLTAPHAMFGLFDGERLIAQAIFHVQDFDAADYTRLATLPGQEPEDAIAVIKGAITHPEHQSRGHFKTLIGAFTRWCADNNIRHALSRVEVTHEASLRTFEKNGFAIVNTVTDARDDAHVHVLHRIIEP